MGEQQPLSGFVEYRCCSRFDPPDARAFIPVLQKGVRHALQRYNRPHLFGIWHGGKLVSAIFFCRRQPR
jgi:hypothetical protein